MKKFRYIGEKGRMNGVFGLDFSDHRAVEVKDPFIIGKLSGNSHFEVVEDTPEKLSDVCEKVIIAASKLKAPEKTETTPPVGATETNPNPEPGEAGERTASPNKPEKTCAGKVGLFRIQKADGKPYSKPDKTFHCKEDAQTYMKEKGINPEERLILEKA